MIRIIGLIVFIIIIVALFKFLWKAAVILLILGGAFFLYDTLAKGRP